jgi:DNA polymerase III subunit delta
VKATRPQIERALDAPPSDIRLFFLYGPDEAGSLSLLHRLERAMGAQAERIDIEGSALKNDPARLADEAASMSMFGDKRWIRLSNVGEESLPAIDALLESAQAGNPVIALGGALKSSAKIVKRCLDHPAVMALASYLPDEREAAQIATNMARERGLHLASPLAHRICALTGGDRALMAGEIEKIALYLDASPEHPMDATAEALDALSAESVEGDIGPLVNAALGGDLDVLNHELAMMDVRGVHLAGVFRPLLTRAMMIAAIRAELDRTHRHSDGESRTRDFLERQAGGAAAGETLGRAVDRARHSSPVHRRTRNTGQQGTGRTGRTA